MKDEIKIKLRTFWTKVEADAQQCEVCSEATYLSHAWRLDFEIDLYAPEKNATDIFVCESCKGSVEI